MHVTDDVNEILLHWRKTTTNKQAHSFMYAITHLCIHSCIIHTHSFTHSFTHALIHALTHSYTQLDYVQIQCRFSYLAKNGPVYSVAWNPKAINFCVVYGCILFVAQPSPNAINGKYPNFLRISSLPPPLKYMGDFPWYAYHRSRSFYSDIRKYSTVIENCSLHEIYQVKVDFLF